jgi:hypothetical protein
MPEFKKNQTVYLDNGRVCQFIDTLSDGRHVISPGYISMEDYDEDTMGDEYHYFSGEKVVGQIFAEPPSAQRDKEIAAKLNELEDLQKEIEAKRAKLEKLRAELGSSDAA